MTDLRLAAENLSVIRCRSNRRAAFRALIDGAGDVLSRRGTRQPRPGEFYALRDVSFELRAGEALGVIGDNGAGKSTLLKTIAGMLEPSAGRLIRRGRIEPVVEIGSGLNPFLTGRENARLEALLKGMSGPAADHYVAAVADFANLADGFDQPVSSYSSGMAARLCFALATQSRPDVLLIDEALAVGDLAFQRRCNRFIEDFLGGGGALMLVSHNAVQVQNICSRALLLDQGRLLFAGSAVAAVRAMVQRSGSASAPGRDPDSPLALERFGPVHGSAQSGEDTALVVRYRADAPIDDVTWGFEIWSSDGQLCITSAQEAAGRSLPQGGGTLTCVIERLPLAPGTYALRLNVVDRVNGTPVLLAGFGAAPILVEVASPPSIASNYQIENGQLAVVDVSWQAPVETAARSGATG